MATVEQYLAPQTLAEATQALAEHDVLMFAGGTDLMLQTQRGDRAFQPVLMNISHIAGLRGINKSDGRIRIGALTTITDILTSELLGSVAPVLVDTADRFAGGQIRNSATLGGNICNASPAADMVVPLLLLDATVELAEWHDGTPARRTLPLSDFFCGPGSTKLKRTEMLTSIVFPVPKAAMVAGFRKCGTRPAMEISIASVGIAGVRCKGRLDHARVAFGSVAPTPVRGRRTEAALTGTVLDKEAIGRIAHIAQEEITPISDVRAGAWYRRQLIYELTRRLLHDVSNTHDQLPAQR